MEEREIGKNQIFVFLDFEFEKRKSENFNFTSPHLPISCSLFNIASAQDKNVETSIDIAFAQSIYNASFFHIGELCH